MLTRGNLAALKYIQRDIIMITCDRKLRNCVHFTYHNVAFAAGITHFTFSLPTLRGLSISLLHDFISSAINLELLSLKAGHVTSTQATRLLRDTNFASLEIFQCNFPHSGLVQFLKRHPRIETIDLGRCRAASGSCPIATKGDTLPTLHSVSGPLSCLSQLIPGRPIETASAQYTCAHDVPSLLSSFLFTTSVIRVLHVDVLPHDVSLLRRISIATPLVSSLKLNELSFKKQHNSSFLPPYGCQGGNWNDDLHALAKLKRFNLSSARQLASNFAQERELIQHLTLGHISLEDIELYCFETQWRSLWHRDYGCPWVPIEVE